MKVQIPFLDNEKNTWDNAIEDAPYCYTNISDLATVPIYEAAIKESSLPLYIAEPSERAPKRSNWVGLWGRRQNLATFWAIFYRLEAEHNAKTETACNQT